MLRELGRFVFRLAILDLFACLCVVSGVEGMAGQGERAGADTVAIGGGLSHGRKKRGGLALIPWLLAFLRLSTVENVMRTAKFTVPFAVFAIRHGRKCDAGQKNYRAFCRFCD